MHIFQSCFYCPFAKYTCIVLVILGYLEAYVMAYGKTLYVRKNTPFSTSKTVVLSITKNTPTTQGQYHLFYTTHYLLFSVIIVITPCHPPVSLSTFFHVTS